MGDHSHQPVYIDPHTLAESQKLWNGFTKGLFWGGLHVVVILILMALFLL